MVPGIFASQLEICLWASHSKCKGSACRVAGREIAGGRRFVKEVGAHSRFSSVKSGRH